MGSPKEVGRVMQRKGNGEARQFKKKLFYYTIR